MVASMVARFSLTAILVSALEAVEAVWRESFHEEVARQGKFNATQYAIQHVV